MRQLTATRQPATLPHPSSPIAPTEPKDLTVTETELERAPADAWDGLLSTLRQRYPGQKDSVLFCLFKLQQNPGLTLRDFREEAQLHGIPMAGRALHSARLLLGIIKREPTPGPAVSEDQARASRRRSSVARTATEGGESIESKVVAAVRQIQTAAGAESGQLRMAIRQAITVLQRALGE